MGYLESLIAVKIIQCLAAFVETHDLGSVLGEAGTLRILPHQVRLEHQRTAHGGAGKTLAQAVDALVGVNADDEALNCGS